MYVMSFTVACADVTRVSANCFYQQFSWSSDKLEEEERSLKLTLRQPWV